MPKEFFHFQVLYLNTVNIVKWLDRYLIKNRELQVYIFLPYLSLRTMCNYENTFEKNHTLETSVEIKFIIIITI